MNFTQGVPRWEHYLIGGIHVTWLGLSGENWWDIALGTIVLAIVPLVLAAYGGHLAAETLGTDPKRQLRTKLTFWGLCASGIIFTFYQQYRQTRTEAKQETENSAQAGEIRDMPSHISQIVAAQYNPLIDRLLQNAATPRTIPQRAPTKAAPSPVVSNAQLRDAAFTLARNLRSLQLQFDIDLENINAFARQVKAVNPGQSSNFSALHQRYDRFQSDFGTYHTQAMNIRDSLLNRLPPQPEPPTEVQITLDYGSTAGANPLYGLADYIEELARQLPQ